MASFFFRGNALWVRGTVNKVRYRLPVNRKNTDIGFNTWYKKADPERVLQELLEETRANGEIEFRKLLDLKNFGFKILDASKEDRGIETQVDYERLFEQKILPFFEQKSRKEGRALAKDISLINAIDICDMLRYLKTQFSDSRVKRARDVLNIILDGAVEFKLIESNLMESRSVKKIKFETVPLTKKTYNTEETKLILANAHGWFKVYLEILFKHGLRAGECMGLKWDDFDLDAGMLFLRRSITKGVITEGTRGNKDHCRDIPLFPPVVELLKKYQEVRPSDEWLFINKDGRCFRESKTIVDYHFKPLLEKIGVEYKTIRATRRSHASIMLLGGSEKENVQEGMGHKKGSNVTDKHYLDKSILKVEHLRKMASNQENIFNSMIEIV